VVPHRPPGARAAHTTSARERSVLLRLHRLDPGRPAPDPLSGTRTQVFPESPEELKLRPDLPVCYVLHEHHLSNLLVLDEECRKLGLPPAMKPLRDAAFSSPRSFFFLSRNERGRLVPNPRSDHAPLLKSLVKDRGKRSALRRATGAGDHSLGARTAQAGLGTEGPVRRNLAAGEHLRHLLAIADPRPPYRGPLQRADFPARTARRRHRGAPRPAQARAHPARALPRQREMAIGPDLSHRRTQLHTLLNTPSVRAAIALDAETRGDPAGAAQKSARDFAFEIASDYTYSVIRAFALFLTWVWNKVYDGVEVHNFERVTTVAPGHGIVYVPCHRSHVDYLLLSYIIFNRGLMVPHIAAGANLNLPVVGSILRRSGAFFLRRKLKGEPLYAAVFLEYLHLMIDRGFPHRILHRGRAQPQRAHAAAQGRHPGHDGAKLRAQPFAAAGVRAGVHRLRKADGGQELHRGASRPAQEVRIAVRPGRRGAAAAAQLRQGARQFRPAPGPGGVPRPAASGLARGSLRYPGAVAAPAPSMPRRCNWRAASMPMRWSIR
jgi:hypothetical protein